VLKYEIETFQMTRMHVARQEISLSILYCHISSSSSLLPFVRLCMRYRTSLTQFEYAIFYLFILVRKKWQKDISCVHMRGYSFQSIATSSTTG
jgi:hypothetical protein